MKNGIGFSHWIGKVVTPLYHECNTKKRSEPPPPTPHPLLYEESNPRLVDYQPSWPKTQTQFPIILLNQQYFHLLHKQTYPVFFCNSSVCLALMYVFWLFSISIIASIHVMYTYSFKQVPILHSANIFRSQVVSLCNGIIVSCVTEHLMWFLYHFYLVLLF